MDIDGPMQQRLADRLLVSEKEPDTEASVYVAPELNGHDGSQEGMWVHIKKHFSQKFLGSPSLNIQGPPSKDTIHQTH